MVVVLRIAAGHKDILKTECHSRFVSDVLLYGCVFFLSDTRTGFGPGSQGKFTAEVTD